MAKSRKRQTISQGNAEFLETQRAKGRLMDRHGRVIPRNPDADVAMKEFWGSVDWSDMRQALLDADDKAAMKLATYMAHNYKTNMSLTRAARECGITLQKLNDLYRNHNLAKAQIIVSAHLPKIAEDTSTDAEAHFEVCDRCDGIGTVLRARMVKSEPDNPDSQEVLVETSETCPRCKGAREIRVAGDSKARDQIFEIAGMTGKSSPLVAIQQNFGSEDLEGTLNMAQKLLQQPAKGDA